MQVLHQCIIWMLLVSRITNTVEEDDNEKGTRFWGFRNAS